MTSVLDFARRRRAHLAVAAVAAFSFGTGAAGAAPTLDVAPAATPVSMQLQLFDDGRLVDTIMVAADGDGRYLGARFQHLSTTDTIGATARIDPSVVARMTRPPTDRAQPIGTSMGCSSTIELRATWSSDETTALVTCTEDQQGSCIPPPELVGWHYALTQALPIVDDADGAVASGLRTRCG